MRIGGKEYGLVFDYGSSWLNDALKILVPVILLCAVYFFYRARKQYEGEIGRVVRSLMVAGIIGIAAMTFRYVADFTENEWKWGESVGYLLFALASFFAVWPLLTFGRKMGDAKPQTPSARPREGAQS